MLQVLGICLLFFGAFADDVVADDDWLLVSWVKTLLANNVVGIDEEEEDEEEENNDDIALCRFVVSGANVNLTCFKDSGDDNNKSSSDNDLFMDPALRGGTS